MIGSYTFLTPVRYKKNESTRPPAGRENQINGLLHVVYHLRFIVTCIFPGTGYFGLPDLKPGSGNVVIGYDAMADICYGPVGVVSQNVINGAGAGKKAMNSSGTVFIGYEAGIEETGSNLLYLANSATATPLVYGNFESHLFGTSGDIEYAGTLAEVSGKRLRTNIILLKGVTEKLWQIRDIRFDWKPWKTGNKRHINPGQPGEGGWAKPGNLFRLH